MEGRKMGNCGVKETERGKRAVGVMERRERKGRGGGGCERRQGVPFPVEPDIANGQLVALGEQFRVPY